MLPGELAWGVLLMFMFICIGASIVPVGATAHVPGAVSCLRYMAVLRRRRMLRRDAVVCVLILGEVGGHSSPLDHVWQMGDGVTVVVTK